MKTASQGLLGPEAVLFEACHSCNVEAVREAVQSGVNMAALNAFGQNAFFFAGKREVAELLLDLGVRDVVDHAGETALGRAIAEGRKEVAACLIERSEVVGLPLHVAAECDDGDTCRLLIESGKVEVDRGNDKAVSALLVACKAGSAAAVRLLLEHADMETTDGRGRNALHLAVIGGHEAVARMLSEADSELAEQRDSEGCRPAEYARDEAMRALAGKREERQETAVENEEGKEKKKETAPAKASAFGGFRLMTFEDEVLDVQAGGGAAAGGELEARANAFFAECGTRIEVVSSSLSCVHIASGKASAPGRIRRTLAVVVRY